ncbi:methyltransferase (TIGR00027 family) [Silvibacterium bohemicum]|uniref:S-adenosyl-L-methionine-dependent methyltransferase n=1 Tax=Silvibacterium bohemicum TaxID=1577686 RepID=A0A841K2F9_9BACT|nr:class I SAM-dependent methyltransferase [Silvibacterium bohemicum]MBB6144828.1 methyltransferase (TIGR00027 family) [Silvibacterium bohemicum]
MDEALPSRTALRVALRRAAHQIYDSPVVFSDPIAVQILGKRYAEELSLTRFRLEKPFSVGLRAFLVSRSLYAEANLARAVAAGVTQYVLLGAGLDTFAYRNPHPQLRVFEVDHPATQAWKRELLQENSISIPGNVHHVPVNFERQSLDTELERAGFEMQAPAFFAWLGVVPYLTLDAFRSTVKFLAARPEGSGVVLDYGQPREMLPPLEQLARDSLAARVQLANEPFQLFFTPEHIREELSEFRSVEDIGSDQINALYFAGRSDQLGVRGASGRMLCAWR